MGRSRNRRIFPRYSMTDSDEMRIKMYLAFGGFHYKTIARRVWGKGNDRYEPSPAEVSRVGVVARRHNMSSRDWRNGLTSESQKLLNRLGRVRKDAKPKLALVS